MKTLNKYINIFLYIKAKNLGIIIKLLIKINNY